MRMRRYAWLAVCLGSFLPLSVVRPSPAPPAEKPDVWIEVASPHFHVLCNDGEKTARRIAQQFEQIRVLYSRALSPDLRLDPGVPIEIVAAKNEKSLSEIIPEYWAEKGHMHPAGLFLPGAERNYIALHADVSGEFPYLPIYHEYVHLIENLNFQHLPLWLDEGYATFFGTATLLTKSGRLGQANKGELDVLKQTKLLPLDVLFRVGPNSPYYNEAEKSNIFYAESWALVHYLMLDERRQNGGQLGRYLRLIENGGDPVDSARASFGDLDHLKRELDSYVSRTSYGMFVVELPDPTASNSFPSRIVTPAEVDATLGAFDVSRSQLDSGRAKIEEALKLDPNLAAAQESMGFLLFREHRRDEAQKYFSRAVAPDSKNALTYYYDGMLLVTGRSEEDSGEALTALEKAVALKPVLAPAWDALAAIYVNDPDSLDKALNAARQAAKLMPGEARYRFNLAVVLLQLEQFDEARAVAQGVVDSADASAADQAKRLLEQIRRAREIKSHDENAEATVERSETGGRENGPRTPESKSVAPVLKKRTGEPLAAAANTLGDSSPESVGEAQPPATGNSSHTYSMTGTIKTAACANPPQMILTLQSGRIAMRLHAGNVAKFVLKTEAGSAIAARPSCTQFTEQTARISYQLVSQKPWEGEIVSIELLDAP